MTTDSIGAGMGERAARLVAFTGAGRSQAAA